MSGIMDNPKLEAAYNELVELNDFTRFWEFFRTNSEIMKTDSAVDYLIARLKIDCLAVIPDDVTLRRRLNTVMMLSAIGTKAQRGVPLLLEIIKNNDDDRLLRSICTEAVRNIGTDSVDNVNNIEEEKQSNVNENDIQSGLITSLQSSLTKPMDPLATYMRSLSFILGEERERGQAASKIGRMGSDAMDAVPLLVKVINSDFENKALRYLCIQSIKQIAPEDKETIHTLLKTLLKKDEAPFVRRACAQAIAEIKPTYDGIIKKLVSLLKNMDDNIYIRKACLDALGEMGENTHEVLTELRRLAKRKNFDLKDVVIKSVKMIEESIGEDVLKEVNKPITKKAKAPAKKKTAVKKSKSTKGKTKPVKKPKTATKKTKTSAKKSRTTTKVKTAVAKKTRAKKSPGRSKSK